MAAIGAIGAIGAKDVAATSVIKQDSKKAVEPKAEARIVESKPADVARPDGGVVKSELSAAIEKVGNELNAQRDQSRTAAARADAPPANTESKAQAQASQYKSVGAEEASQSSKVKVSA